MRPSQLRELQAHARRHSLKLLRVWNVVDAYDQSAARAAICEAADVLSRTTDDTAYTRALPGKVAVKVKKLSSFKP